MTARWAVRAATCSPPAGGANPSSSTKEEVLCCDMVPLLFVVTIFEMDSDGERRFALLRCGKPEKILAGR